MIFWVLAASLCAVITVCIVTPLMKNNVTQKTGWVIVVVLPILALGLYAILGRPDLAIY